MATPTEAAGMGAAGALVLAAAYRKLTWAGFQRALLQSLGTSSMVLVLALTSNIFGAVFAGLGAAAVETLASGAHGVLVGIVKNDVVATPLAEIAGRTRPADASLLELARVMAI